MDMLRRVGCILVALIFLGAVQTVNSEESEFQIEPGLTGHWFNPDRSGEGLVLEVLDAERILLYWFTYDEEGNQRWMLDVGRIQEDTVFFETLTTANNGRFGPNLPNSNLTLEEVGTAQIQFLDCNNAVFQFDAFGQQIEYELQRLSQTMAAGCSPINGVLGQPVKSYAGETGSWFDPDDSGEGFTLQWLSQNQALIVWFTFDPNGNQFWMTSIGQRTEDGIFFPELLSASGGRFGAAFDPDQVVLEGWGSLSFDVECDGGSAQYTSLRPEFGSGAIDLGRLTLLENISCPWVQPSITDLYDVNLIWFNETQETLGSTAISNTGVVLGRRSSASQPPEVLLAETDSGLETDWMIIPGFSTSSVENISPEGKKIIVNDVFDFDSPSFIPRVWHSEEGWTRLTKEIFQYSVADAVSMDLSYVAGRGRNSQEDPEAIWIWSEETGQVELALASEFKAIGLVGISNDGSTAIAEAFGTPGDLLSRRTILWDSETGPRFLTNSEGVGLGIPAVCDADCSVIAGVGFFEPPALDLIGRAWFVTTDSVFGLLDFNQSIDDPEAVLRAVPTDITADGSMIVGLANGAIGQQLTSTGFIWTTATGAEFSSDLLAEVGLENLRWSTVDVRSVSPDGRLVLIAGLLNSVFEGITRRTIVLELTEK